MLQQFAPRCYHCETAIVDERFITLDDPELGKRTYHEQHFFCAECGDPFLPPASPGAPSRTFAGDGEFTASAEDDVGCWADDEDLRPVRASQIDMVRAGSTVEGKKPSEYGTEAEKKKRGGEWGCVVQSAQFRIEG